MISTKELEFLNTTLKKEKLLMKKYSFYKTLTNNNEIKILCDKIVSAHKFHFDTLMPFLQNNNSS